MIKILILISSLFFLNGCLFVGLDKGAYPDSSLEFERYFHNQNVGLKINNSLYIKFASHQCGYYGLEGIIVPIIPHWKNYDCKDLNVYISKSSNVYIKHKDKIYNYSIFRKKSYFNYTFPIATKSLSDGAILVIEQGEEKFEIPFRYKHGFSFVLWGT